MPKVPAKAAKAEKKASKPVSKPGTKAQASGMSMNDLRGCRSALAKLQTHKKAAMFLQPVDPIRDRAPK